MSEDEAPGDLSKLTVDPNPDLFMLWNYRECRTLADMETLNYFGTLRIAEHIDHAINIAEHAFSVDPNFPRNFTTLIETIDGYSLLVWPQKNFFINEIVLPYQNNSIIRLDHMHNSIENGLLSPKNEEISKFLKQKLYAKTVRP
jgi:hypothetical protein